MQSFEWVDVTSIDEAAALLAASSDARPVLAKAGGIDLLDLMKEGIVRPSRVVNLKTIAGLDELTFESSGGLRIGALVTLTQLADARAVRDRYPALAEAAR